MNTQRECDALELPNIDDFLKREYSFFVPKYQRGYRWTSEQVTRLVYDLCEFQKDESMKNVSERCPFYSLQVLVVQEKANENEQKEFEVIDGQQRLTTMLLLRQAYHIVTNIEKSDFVDAILETGKGLLPRSMYQIKYETRIDSNIWLKELTEAYLKDIQNGTKENIENFQQKNRDYNHFAEVLLTGIELIKTPGLVSRNSDWEDILTNTARFIWYDKSKVGDADDNEMIFNRLNATKIKLNNAELIKALFLQEGVYKNEGMLKRDQMALDWDDMEKRLQDPEFWMFICNSRYATAYSSHIEYLFDLLQNKTEEHRDKENYTFDCYYDKFHKAEDKFCFVQEEWKKLIDMYQTLREWFDERHFYHLTGYLLEYGQENGRRLTIPMLIEKLYVDKECKQFMPKDKWRNKLKELVKNTLKDLKLNKLTYKNPEMTQVLMLFNVIQEDRRDNPNARFSFNSYKRIMLGLDGLVWHQEHVASHVDYTPDLEKRQELAIDLLEYFTGGNITKEQIKSDEKRSDLDIEERPYIKIYKEAIKGLPDDEQKLCNKLLTLFDSIPDGEMAREEKEKELQQVFYDVNEHFKAIDPLDDEILLNLNHGTKSEKDFIWNFVLLNSKTNMSYGNSIFPVKRKRILKDEGSVFTMFGTRNVFDKTYSHRLSNLLSWGRKDALDYWLEIKRTLKDYLPSDILNYCPDRIIK